MHYSSNLIDALYSKSPPILTFYQKVNIYIPKCIHKCINMYECIPVVIRAF